MEKTDCIQAGRIVKTFGYKGEVIAHISEDFAKIIIKKGSIFIETDEELVPYFIESFEWGDKELHTIKFEDINDVGQAKAFSGNIIWFPTSMLPEGFTLPEPLSDIQGYTVIDKEYGEIGMAEDITELPSQSILRILQGDREILLPVNDDFILKVDRKKRQILIHAPQGLIESYLG